MSTYEILRGVKGRDARVVVKDGVEPRVVSVHNETGYLHVGLGPAYEASEETCDLSPTPPAPTPPPALVDTRRQGSAPPPRR